MRDKCNIGDEDQMKEHGTRLKRITTSNTGESNEVKTNSATRNAKGVKTERIREQGGRSIQLP